MFNPLETYLKAYPAHIVRVTESSIVWKDGTEMSTDATEKRTFQNKLNNPDLLDQMSIPYIYGPEGVKKAAHQENYDPGRLRYIPLFKKMYGQTKEEVEKNLVWVEWLPKSLQKTKDDDSVETYKLRVTKINDVAGKVEAISRELDDLPEEYKPFLENPGGTFCYRVIAGTDRPSAHSFGMTIDINVKLSNYWQWDYKEKLGLSRETVIDESDIDRSNFPEYANQIPEKIVEIFEQYGFIWGGKWYHYDTMHFEYRPEFLPENLPTKLDTVDVGLSGAEDTQIEQTP